MYYDNMYLLIQFCREQNRAMLRELYYQEDAYQEEANCRVIESYDEEVENSSTFKFWFDIKCIRGISFFYYFYKL